MSYITSRSYRNVTLLVPSSVLLCWNRLDLPWYMDTAFILTVFPVPKWTKWWSHHPAVKISSRAWGWCDTAAGGYHCSLWLMEPVHPAVETQTVPALQMPSASWAFPPSAGLAGVLLSVCSLLHPERLSHPFSHTPKREQLQQIWDCGVQGQGPRASRWSDSPLLSLPSTSTKPCHALMPPLSIPCAKPSPSLTAHFFISPLLFEHSQGNAGALGNVP